MKKAIVLISVLAGTITFLKTGVGIAQIQPNTTGSQVLNDKNDRTEASEDLLEKLISLQQTDGQHLKWSAPVFLGLQLGKATENDVIRAFGEPINKYHPFDEEVSRKNEWMFHFENIGDFDGRTEFLFDIHSKILKEVWLSPNYERPLQIEKAIEIYGRRFWIHGIGENFCSSKQLSKIEYPFVIVYPEKGLFLWIREDNYLETIFYFARCPR